MNGHESLRASDADRDAVTDRLREAAGEGRLEPEELEQRVDAALRAHTYGELARLVADLPADAGAPWQRPRTRPLARSALLGAGLLAAVTVALALVALVVVLVLAAAALAAAWWFACVVFWLVCCGSRRRLTSCSAWRHRTRAHHVHRTRPAGLL
jgi:hypothetical protein